MQVLRPPEARKPDFPTSVTLKQDGQVATCHPRGSCIQWSRRCQEPLPRRGQLSYIGSPKPGNGQCSWPSSINRNWLEFQTRNSGKVLLGPLLQQVGKRENNNFPCPFAPPKLFFMLLKKNVSLKKKKVHLVILLKLSTLSVEREKVLIIDILCWYKCLSANSCWNIRIEGFYKINLQNIFGSYPKIEWSLVFTLSLLSMSRSNLP